MRTRFILTDSELHDLRALMLALNADRAGAALIGRIGHRGARDRNFLYLRDRDDKSRGYRASAPTEAFAQRFLELLSSRSDEVKGLLGRDFHEPIDRLIERYRHTSLETAAAGTGAALRTLASYFGESLRSGAPPSWESEATFGGWKIIFYVGFENTGRITRDVIRFSKRDDQITYTWWSQTAGAAGPAFRREDQGIVVPLNACYFLMGVQGSGRPDDRRVRTAVIQRHAPHIPTIGVQAGIVLSTNESSSYPVAARFLWVTVADEYVYEPQVFLDRTVGLFGGANGLDGLRMSFEGAGIDDDAIALIWLYINNSTEATQLLSARQEGNWNRDVSVLVRQDWRVITESYKEASSLDA